MDLNIVCLIGKLTDSAKSNATRNGGTSLAFTITVDRYKDAKDDISMTYYGKNAETLAPYMTRGRQVAVKGRLQVDNWTYNGKDYSKLVIVAEEIEVLGFKKDDRGEPVEGPHAEPQGPENWNDDDDIPF